jgi:hypothetical protein
MNRSESGNLDLRAAGTFSRNRYKERHGVSTHERWFANKGQILQFGFQAAALLVGVAGLIVASVKAWPDLTSNQYFSSGAFLFYFLIGLVVLSIAGLSKQLRAVVNRPLTRKASTGKNDVHDVCEFYLNRDAKNERFAELMRNARSVWVATHQATTFRGNREWWNAFWNIHAPKRRGFVPSLPQRLNGFTFLSRCAPDFSVDTRGLTSFVLRHSFDGESFRRERASEETLQGGHFTPALFFRCLHDSGLEPTHVLSSLVPVEGVPSLSVRSRTSVRFFKRCHLPCFFCRFAELIRD